MSAKTIVSRLLEDHEPWIGVDLDGTLAKDSGWKGKDHIGEPVPKMLERVKQWLKAGKKVKILTARAADPKAIPPIKAWLKKHGLEDVGVTNEKDPGLTELWDDKAVEVEKNRGTEA